ncbi:hypothetical protein [Marinobacterium rhizophilum]|uniref:Uncharacterized protein n=1 Tax=Marinobacterium rhizophilum TaxID=420402 RepID=A0ABY5HK43_9GAMM|nr:hypothetical protein [Marinobacterium rhizophilum]UTW12489.1 hypothetical protein KDW95_02045 [Marinobacterium rhizophilum]
MQKSVLLLCGIVVAAATLGAANEALKPGPVQPVDIESRIPSPALEPDPRPVPAKPAGDDTAHLLLPSPDTFPIDERGESSPIPDNLA